LAVLQTSITNLTEGISSSKSKIDTANEIAFERVAVKFTSYCSICLPSKSIRISKVDPSKLDEGVQFDMRKGETWTHSLTELSGGQKTVVAICFLLAVASFALSAPFYLFDEVDSALDEVNSEMVSGLLSKILPKSQIICVSHQPAFFASAKWELRLVKRGDRTVVEKTIKKHRRDTSN